MQKVVRYFLASVIVLVHSFSLAGEKRLIEIEDYFTQAFIVECALSPDGKQVAYVELRWEPPRDSRNADLWVVDVKTKETRRLTFDSTTDSNPVWSPDSKQVYFTSRRKKDDNQAPYNGKTQVFRLDLSSELITPITRVEDGIEAFELSKDGKTLYYSVNDDAKDGPWAALRKAHQSVEYGLGERNTTEIWKLDLKSWRTSKIVDEKKFIREFAVSPDETQIAMITAYDDLLITHEGQSQVDIFHVETGKSTKITDDLWRKFEPNRHGWLEHPAWSPDGERIAFRVDFDGYPAEVFCADVSESQVWQIKRPPGVTIYGGDIHWQGDCLCFLGDIRARTHLYQVCDVKDGGQGKMMELTKGDLVVFEYSMANDGTLCVIKADPQSGRDLFLVQKPTTLLALTETNPQMDEWKLPQISLVEWEGANGDKVEGILELPPDYKKSDGKIPTIVQIHGGPTSAEPYCFRYWPYGRTLLPSKGFALLMPNYRGSTGYGDKFMTDLIGRENEIEVEDILKGVDWLVEQGIADPDKLGVMGWSNGGYLTNALITKTNRFKAASSGAGVIDQVLQWGLEDTPGHVINFMAGSLPWQNPELYRKSSPLYQLDKVTTPTLIHVGENDARVPAAHGKTLFRGLSRYGKAPTQLITYPGAGHSPTTYAHRKAKMAWDLAWFQHYLRGERKKPSQPNILAPSPQR